jgi:dTDP-3-amino-3,4,6-trideoxy-alpha-D-glucose transaminase
MATAQTERVNEVPFVDLTHVHTGLTSPILDGIAALIERNAYTNGPEVEAFEQAFALYCGRVTCVGLSCGLDALRLGLVAAGLGEGDEVILPANTFAATAAAVVQAGGRPVVVDVSESDYNIDPDQVEAAVTHRTRFLLPVHLYGQMADMRALDRIAERRELAVIEDACQAHGAARDGITAGGSGLAAAFSFYPSKNLGALGDGGAIVADDPSVVATIRALREHGQTKKYHHDMPGWTARLDTIQAIVLLHKLPLLEGWNEWRRRAADHYQSALDGVGDLQLLPVPPGSRPVWHLYPIRTKHADALERHLRLRGIGTGRHYPQPIHLMPAFARFGGPEGSCPVAEALARETLTIAMFPGITEAQLEAVTTAICDFFRG